MRRALDADKDSFAYKASHNIKDDYAQYKEWTDIVGQENMPKSLAEFQELKYNDNDKFGLLSDYKFSIENKRISASILFKDFAEMKVRIQREIIGMTTIDGVEIKSQSKHFLERVLGNEMEKRKGVDLDRVKECLANASKIVNKIDSIGRKSRVFYSSVSKCMVSVNVDDGNLIQTNPYGG